MSCHQIRLFNCVWVQMGPLWDLREVHKKKEGSVICRLDYRTWKHSLWHRGSCCTANSFCDPGTQFDTAPEYLHLWNESVFTFIHSQTLRPGPSAPQQWPLLSLDGAEEKAGDAREQTGRMPVYPSAVPGAGPRGARGSVAGHCLPIHPRDWSSPSGESLEPCASYCSPETVAPRAGAGQQRPKFAIEMTSYSLIYGFNLWANSPSLTGEGRKFPSLYSSFHFLLFASEQGITGLQQQEASFFFLWKKYWNLVQGKACNISQPHVPYHYWKISIAITAATKRILHLIITWPKKWSRLFYFHTSVS